MKIQLKFFAMLRAHFGTGEREVDIPEETTVREIFLKLFQDRRLAERLLRSTRFAVNCEYVPPDTLVREADEVAFIPPVSGG